VKSSLEQLIDAGGLVPRPGAFDWDEAESRLQTRIPADFRMLLDAGGAGLWFDYIQMYAPGKRYQDFNLLDSGAVWDDLLLFWEDELSAPPADMAADARLIAWASTGAGHQLFWQTRPGTPSDAYPIYFESHDGDRWERFDMTTTDFLLGISRGDVRSELLSKFLMNVSDTFKPYNFDQA
jgi:hypothetical protein